MSWSSSYTWKTPVTDWENRPYFNINDYKRITNNLNYLNELCYKLRGYNYKEFLTNNVDYSGIPRASEFNKIEDSLKQINKLSYALNIESDRVYYTNSNTCNYKDLNRIESACALLYTYMKNELKHEQHLKFTLNGAKRF